MPKLSAKDFYNKYWDLAVKVTEGTGIYPEVLMAQMATESTWGNTLNERNGYAGFGVKAHDKWKGKTIDLNTWENKNGQRVDTKATFQAYDSVEDAMKGYIENLQATPSYGEKGVFQAESPDDQIQRIKDAGYATSDNYAPFIQNMMKEAKQMGLGGGNSTQFEHGDDKMGYKKDENGKWKVYRYDPEGRKTRGNNVSETTGNWEDDYDVQNVAGDIFEFDDKIYVFDVNKNVNTIKELPSYEDTKGDMYPDRWNPYAEGKGGANSPMSLSQFTYHVADNIKEKRGDGQLTTEDHNQLKAVLGMAKGELTPEKYEEFAYNVSRDYLVPAWKKDLEVADDRIQSEIDALSSEMLKASNDPDKRAEIEGQLVQLRSDQTEFRETKDEIYKTLEVATSAQKTKHEWGDARDLPLIGHLIVGAGMLEEAIVPDSWTKHTLYDYGSQVPVGVLKPEKIAKLSEFRNNYKPWFTDQSEADTENSVANKDPNTYYPGQQYKNSASTSTTYKASGTHDPIDFDWGGEVANRSPWKTYSPNDYEAAKLGANDRALDLDDNFQVNENGEVKMVPSKDPKKAKDQIDALNAQIEALNKPTEKKEYQEPERLGFRDHLLDIGRGVLGLKGALEDVPVYERGDMWQTAASEMTARRDMGLSPDEIAFRKNMAERGYGYDVKNIRRLAGGSAGVALGNLGRATGQLYDQYDQLAAADEATRRMNRQQFYQGAAQDESINRQIFEDELQQKMMTKQAGAGLLNDALKNIQDRQQFEKAYGPDSQYYKYKQAQIEDAEMRTEGMRQANEERKQENIKTLEDRRDRLQKDYEGMTNNVSQVDANTKATPVTTETTTTVTDQQGGGEQPTDQQGTGGGTTTTQPGGGIVKDAGGDIPTVEIKDSDLPGTGTTDKPTDAQADKSGTTDVQVKTEETVQTGEEKLPVQQSQTGQPGGGIIGDAGADMPAQDNTTKTTSIGADNKYANMSDEELENEGVTRTVSENEQGDKTVVYSEQKEISQEEVWQKQIADDPGSLPYVRSNMINDNPEFKAAMTSISEEYDSQEKDLQSQVTELEENGEFKKAKKIQDKIQKLRAERSKKADAVNKQYNDWADSIIDGWSAS